MMDVEFAKWLLTLGVGGALAAFMFAFYCKDVRAYTELWKGQSDILMQTIKDNTAAITTNTMVIDALHRRLDLAPSERPLPLAERRAPREDSR